ncbi:hypothetical protein ACIQPS_14320 [Streptomyces sp. NPDC091290]|uniref:deazapurine DNA modification protein DpdA family protein n=1 Tax=Streptomyces sp. NPDC091290 TaxID=3365990 RepID=UPI00382495C2
MTSKSEHFAAAVKLYPACGRYAVDSGGFTELQRHGRWTRSPRQYVDDLRRIWEHVGPYDWAAGQDWMCEDLIIHGGTTGRLTFVGTKLSVPEHQRRTVHNFLELRSLAPTLRIIPTLQGRTVAEYHACADLYESYGVDLRQEPTVGLGSVCRLQSTKQGAAIVTAMAARGYRLHGFGFKILGLNASGTCWPPRTPRPGATTPASGPRCPATHTGTAPTASTMPCAGVHAFWPLSPPTGRRC